MSPLPSLVVQIGDSIPAGTWTNGYSAINQLGYDPALVTINNSYSTSAHTLAQVGNDVPGGLASLYDPTKRCIVVIQRGTNDFGIDNRSAADAYALLSGLAALYKSQGFYVAVCTLLPRKTSSTYPWSQSQQDSLTAYNTLVRNNAAGADVVLDFAADPVMGAANAPDDTALFSDKLHPTVAGQDRLVPLYKAAIEPLMRMAPRSVVSISGSQAKQEGGAGSTTAFVYTVSRTVTAGALNVGWTFAPGGTDAADYAGGTLPAGGTLAFADGASSRTITINVAGDATVENDETFTITLQPGSGYVLGAASAASGTIQNDDGPTSTFLRFTATGLTETANGGGYDYVSSGSTGFTGSPARGYSTTRIAANSDGGFSVRNTGSPAADGILAGLSTSAAPSGFGQCLFVIFTSNGFPNGSVYWDYIDAAGNVAASSIPFAAGDRVRCRRAGTTGYLEVSKDAGSSWTAIYTASGITTAALTPYIESGTPGAGGVVSLAELIAG